MKAGIYHGIGKVSIKEIDKPIPKDDDVIINVVQAGICGTDVGAYTSGGDAVGIYPENEFGHEFVGVVDEVGKNVKDISVGMRVTINPTARRPLSSGMNSTEIADMTGAFSEYVFVESAKLGYNVFELPDGLSFDDGVLTEPLAVSTHGIGMSEVKKGDKALIYGAGTIGLAAVAALQRKGVTDIIVSDINEFKLAKAKELGAVPFNSKEGNLVDFVKKTYGTQIGNLSEETWNVDTVIDCAGAPHIMKEFMDNAKCNSTFVEVAISMTPTEVSPFYLLAKEVKLCGSRGYTPEDIVEAMDTLNNSDCKLTKIITHTFQQDELEKAFEVAADPNKAIKVVIKY